MKRENNFKFYPLVMIGLLCIITSSCLKEEKWETPTATTDTVSDITDTTAICKGTVFDNGGYLEYNHGGFCWSNIIKVPTSLNQMIWSSLSGTGSYTCKLRNLSPGTTYYVCAVASKGDVANYGTVISFMTTGSITGDIVFNPDSTYGSLTDAVGNIYKTIKIGSQTWMAENLKTTKYNDGTDISHVTDVTEWSNLTTPGYCYYLNDSAKYGNIYGALYNWYTVNTEKLCPTGWHVPSNTEWATLTTFLGGNSVAAGMLKETGTTHWIKINTGVTNISGFTILPGGGQYCEIGYYHYFDYIGYRADFWSSTEYASSPGNAYLQDLYMNDNAIVTMYGSKNYGFSVRCLRD